MNYTIELKNVLAVLAENLLPRSSGHSKILEVCIKFTQNDTYMFAKVIFFRPNNYMLVSYAFENELSHIEDDNFEITSNHDSTWKYDGFNFFRNIMKDPEDITISSFKILEIENPIIDDTNRTFSFTRK